MLLFLNLSSTQQENWALYIIYVFVMDMIILQTWNAIAVFCLVKKENFGCVCRNFLVLQEIKDLTRRNNCSTVQTYQVQKITPDQTLN
jgi:hypothetical protein